MFDQTSSVLSLNEKCFWTKCLHFVMFLHPVLFSVRFTVPCSNVIQAARTSRASRWAPTVQCGPLKALSSLTLLLPNPTATKAKPGDGAPSSPFSLWPLQLSIQRLAVLYIPCTKKLIIRKDKHNSSHHWVPTTCQSWTEPLPYATSNGPAGR